MFGRPRCREWTPLATQQLRLRNLIQIVGYNIRPPEWCPYQCSFYLTLHHTTMSAPYYTSERICSPHPKWKEIDPEITQSLSSTNVVIRVWSHAISADENIQDTVIQTWGVYLSGLRYIGANLASNFNSDCFKSNTLVFQMHGGYFCSYKSLKIDVIPPENDHSSLSSDSSGRTNAWKNLEKVMESSSSSPHKFVRRIDSEYSKSHSPVEKGFQHHIPTMRTSTSLNIRNEKIIYEHSPERNVKEFTGSDINCDNISKNTSQEELFTSMVDLSETAEMYDLRNEYEGVPKYRYLALNFLKSEIRPSYTASKLQKLHILQYSIKKKQEAVQDIKERIYNNLALNYRINLEESFDTNQKQKCRSQRSLFSMDSSEDLKRFPSQSDLNGKVKERAVSSGPRLGLKLNDLLSYKVKPSPFQRSEHIRLTKQLEILRFKRIILSDERDSKLANIRRLKERHAKLAEENQDVGTELMQNYHTLSRCTEALKETRQSCVALRELAARSHASLSVMRTELLTQLHQIFYIEQRDPQTWSIVSLPLRVCSDEEPRAAAPAPAATGLAAQALVLAASVLDQPTRYAISLRGSATTILDVTPDLPDPNIPLYPRGGDVTLFRYAMFLLNKCIGQLLAGRGMPIADIRPTLFNLQRLLTSHNHLSDTSKLYGIYRWLSDSQCPRTQSLRSLIASERGKYRQFNRFKDAIDGQSPQSVMNVRRHRHSRSVGSYHDDQELAALNTSTTSIMGSESNIYNMKLPQNDSNELNSLTKHNSEPELQSLESDKVLFSLGDTAIRDLESQLVRLSTNNGDEITCHCQNDICQSDINVNVTRICTEINDFCSQEIQEGFDVAKYMENKRESVVSEIEEADKCMSCEGKGEGECQLECAKKVTDVIVIPSAEAILDTGQNHGEN